LDLPVRMHADYTVFPYESLPYVTMYTFKDLAVFVTISNSGYLRISCGPDGWTVGDYPVPKSQVTGQLSVIIRSSIDVRIHMNSHGGLGSEILPINISLEVNPQVFAFAPRRERTPAPVSSRPRLLMQSMRRGICGLATIQRLSSRRSPLP
jgi:hypothetical protein